MVGGYVVREVKGKIFSLLVLQVQLDRMGYGTCQLSCNCWESPALFFQVAMEIPPDGL